MPLSWARLAPSLKLRRVQFVSALSKLSAALIERGPRDLKPLRGFLEAVFSLGGSSPSGHHNAISASAEMPEELTRPEGLEPPTPWFEAKCSIQLS